MARKLAAGNWKMNGTGADLEEIRTLLSGPVPGIEVLICPPATLLSRLSDLARGSFLMSGGQDCHVAQSGAHTGDISAAMLKEAGASHVILGHSERRADHGETDALVRAKAEAALAEGLIPVICVGETEAERDAGDTVAVVTRQMQGSLPDNAGFVLAYEPIWAIGTGRTPTLAEIAEVHGAMRAELTGRYGAAGADVPLLYGGSVKPANASEIFAIDEVDGALVGGASLKAKDFDSIIAALDVA